MFDVTFFSYGAGLVMAFWFVGFVVGEVLGVIRSR